MEGNPLIHIMYDAWVNHGILPSTIYNLSEGEKELLASFLIIKRSPRG